jgi:nucleotide-binding universal stress UspA family protein
MVVIVGVDESGDSWNALRVAAKEAGWRHARLIAITAYRPGRPAGAPDSSQVLSAAQPAGPDQAARTRAELALHDAVEGALGADWAGVDLQAVAGIAGRAIVDAARDTRAQLIVLAVRSGIAFLPGTASQYVLRHARCPVLLVPAGSGG